MAKEPDHAEDFNRQLERIEYQAARVAQNSQNTNFDLDQARGRDLRREKSIYLMTAIVKFFNSALLYFNSKFFGKISCPLYLVQ